VLTVKNISELSSGTRPTLHIITFSTQHEHSEAMLESWNRWIHTYSMVTFDNNFLYEFHPRTHALNASGTGRHNDRAWLAAMHHKIYAIHDLRTRTRGTSARGAGGGLIPLS